MRDGQARLADLPVREPGQGQPDDGIADFLETPRFSTGYAALHHTIGFMPETHMLKPFADRYTRCARWSRRRSTSRSPTAQIVALRRAAKAAGRSRREWPIHWAMDEAESVELPLQGLRAKYKPSVLGDYQRLCVRPQRAVRTRHRLLQPLPGRHHRVGAARLRGAAAVARSDRAPAVERRADGTRRGRAPGGGARATASER
jgi:hypothetical protein